MHAFDVHMPAFTMQQPRDAAVAIPHPDLGDLADALSEGRLLGSPGTIVIRRAACRNRSAGSADRHPERGTREVDHLAAPSWRHSLRRITSCSISLSSVRSATTLRSRVFLLLELPQLFHLRWHQAAIQLLPAIKRRFRDAHLAAHLGNLRSALRLLERKRNLAGFSHSERSNFRGGAQLGERLVRNEEVRGSTPLGSTS